MPISYLSTGSNLGDRRAYLERACALLAAEAGRLIAASPLYETAAWGKTDQPAFYNQVLAIETDLDAQVLLNCCRSIEQRLGRERHERWAERTIDIDILAIEQAIIETDSLSLPHPRLHERRFVLQPLCDLAPDWWHPLLQQSAAQLLAQCTDELPVLRLPD